MEYRILGSLEVRCDGRLAELGPPKQRAVLAILLLHAGEVVPTDRLIDLLWGERPPRTAAHSIQIYVSELRKALDLDGPLPAILTRPPGYVLEADPELIDARRFEVLVAQGTSALEAGDPSTAAQRISEALELWEGPPLFEFTYEEFAQDEIRRLEGLRVKALEVLASAELARDREQAALAAIETAVTEDPLSERARELQMLALCRAGRNTDALHAYQAFRALLSTELGVDPSPSLQRLYERVLLHDPGLSAAPGPTTGSVRREKPDMAREAEETVAGGRHRPVERGAESWRWALIGTIVLLAAAVTFGALGWLGNQPPDVALVFEGTGDSGFGDMAAEGFDRVVSEFGLDAETRLVSAGTNEIEVEIRQLSDDGVDLVVVGIGVLGSNATTAVAVDHPETKYLVWENEGDLPNVTNVTFRSGEGAFLVGAAAALKSRSGMIAFIGGSRFPVLEEYLAGYEAGARSVDPNVQVHSTYLGQQGDMSGFVSPTLGAEAAARLYSSGSDVIFAVAGTSGLGVLEVASSRSEELGRHLWAIGTDTDQYRSVLAAAVPDGEDPRAWQPHILTSVTKRLDLAFYAVLSDYAAGQLKPGLRSFGLPEGGVDIAYSGGFISDIRPELEGLRDRIISGEIDVPTEPSDKVVTEGP